jgi:hypothetical protein
MASDRGTLPRGGDQHAPWVGPTAPAGRRLPSAPRERKPALAVLAVLLIVGGALAAGLLVVRSGQRVGAIEVTQTVVEGEHIPLSAMSEVMIASDSGLSYVGWQYQSQVPVWYASTTIPPGTVLNNNMLRRTNPLSNVQATDVGLALKDGQVPAGLQVGDTINIYSTQDSASGTGCPGKPGATLALGATVLSAAPSSAGTGTTDVEVAMDAGAVGPVVCNTANGTAAIAITRGTGGG